MSETDMKDITDQIEQLATKRLELQEKEDQLNKEAQEKAAKAQMIHKEETDIKVLQIQTEDERRCIIRYNQQLENMKNQKKTLEGEVSAAKQEIDRITNKITKVEKDLEGHRKNLKVLMNKVQKVTDTEFPSEFNKDDNEEDRHSDVD